MTAIESIILEVPDPTAAHTFYEAFGVRASQTPASGFRGFTLSLVVSQPDGTIWKVATSSHRIAIGTDGGPFTDPDGFAWEAVSKP